MIIKKPRAGGDVDSYCTKCRMDLNHRVIAMVGDEVKRVECLTCHGQHNYRKPASEKAKEKERSSSGARAASPRAAAGAAASASKAERSPRAQWEKAIAGQPPGAFRPYTIQTKFAAGDLVRHSRFGDGVVARVVDANKVEILFEDGARTMAQGA